MELISLKYAIFVIALLVLYYCFPKKYRWYVLLAGSMAYYVIICKWYVLFIIFTICTTYGSTIWIDKLLKKQNAIVKSHKEDWDRQTRKEYKEKGRKKRVAVMLFALLCNFGILAFLKYIPYAGGAWTFASTWHILLHLPIHGLCDGCIQGNCRA